jgi:hypothetical protein
MENNIATLSIYYAREEWVMLIKKCIIPLIRSMNLNTEDSDINVLLRLYGDDEQNCQLIIYGISEQFNDTVSCIEEIVKKFLAQYPSHESDIYKFKPGQSLWMPPPNNSVKLCYSNVDAYLASPKFLFYKQSITNLLIDWLDVNEDIQFNEEDVYTFTLFVQLVLLKTTAYYNWPLSFTELFIAIESGMDIHNNMRLYNEVITNSSAAYNRNIEQIKEYYRAIDFGDKEDDILCYHYTTIHAILSKDSQMYFVKDYLIKTLMLVSYDLLGITGIKQLYVLNMTKMFCSDHLKISMDKSIKQVLSL